MPNRRDRPIGQCGRTSLSGSVGWRLAFVALGKQERLHVVASLTVGNGASLAPGFAMGIHAAHYSISALFRSRSVESSPLLLHFGASAFRALDLAFIMFRNRKNQRELFVAGVAKVFIVRHGFLPRGKSPTILVALT